MNQPRIKNVSRPIQNFFWLGILAGFVLILVGRILIPQTNLPSIGGACLILVVYGLIVRFGIPKIRLEILNPASIIGLLAGILFTGEIILEYVLLPQDNTNWGLIEFGAAFLLFLLSGLWAVYKTGRFQLGPFAAVISAMLSGLIWLTVVLAVFYIFRGTARQTLVFTAEGNYADFAKSGMSDFDSFIMEDFLGAAFFHLLLSPIIAFFLGSLGGLIGKGLGRFRSHDSQ
jgi:hypothetical protein